MEKTYGEKIADAIERFIAQFGGTDIVVYDEITPGGTHYASAGVSAFKVRADYYPGESKSWHVMWGGTEGRRFAKRASAVAYFTKLVERERAEIEAHGPMMTDDEVRFATWINSMTGGRSERVHQWFEGIDSMENDARIGLVLMGWLDTETFTLTPSGFRVLDMANGRKGKRGMTEIIGGDSLTFEIIDGQEVAVAEGVEIEVLTLRNSGGTGLLYGTRDGRTFLVKRGRKPAKRTA